MEKFTAALMLTDEYIEEQAKAEQKWLRDNEPKFQVWPLDDSCEPLLAFLKLSLPPPPLLAGLCETSAADDAH